jgi:ATP-dependent Clp protease adaptor protein ClpS
MVTKGNTKEDTKALEEILEDSGISTSGKSNLILHNDDLNSFEWVEYCLITLMKFTPERAERTAWTAHLQGKAILKSGSKDILMPYIKMLEEPGLTVSIE